MLFIHWAHGASATRQGPGREDHTADDYLNRIFRCKELAWEIVDLTRSTTGANPLLLYPLHRQSNLESIISGDDGKLKTDLKEDKDNIMVWEQNS